MPVIIKAKILLQHIWQSKLLWDEPLPTNISETWANILANLIELLQLSVQRPYFKQKHDDCNMFVFSDASMKKDYGAVVYISQVTLVMSKSRVAPTKTITLPKLELMAAVMATRLANFITCSLYNYHLSTTTHLWTVRQIVISTPKQPNLKKRQHEKSCEIKGGGPDSLVNLADFGGQPITNCNRMFFVIN